MTCHFGRLFLTIVIILMLNSTAIEVEFRIEGITQSNLTRIIVQGHDLPVYTREGVTISLRKTPTLGVVLVIRDPADWNFTRFHDYGTIVRDYLMSEEYTRLVVTKIPATQLYIQVAGVGVNVSSERLEQLLDSLGGKNKAIFSDYDVSVRANCANGSFFDVLTGDCIKCLIPGVEQYADRPCGVVSNALIKTCDTCKSTEYEYCPCGYGGYLCPTGNRICYPYPIWNATVNALVVSTMNVTGDARSYGQWIANGLTSELRCQNVTFIINGLPQVVYKDLTLNGNVSYFWNISFGLETCWNPARTGQFLNLTSITNAALWKFLTSTSALAGMSCGGLLIESYSSGVLCVPPSCGIGEEGVPGRCFPCKVGTFKPNYGEDSCTPCNIGYYMPTTGASACVRCPLANTVTSSVRSTRLQDCKCDVGFYARNSSYCQECPSGTYSTGFQASACLSCSPGSYSAASRSISCRPCGLNQYSGGFGRSSCGVCDTGTGQYLEVTGGTACKRCGIGQGLYLDADQRGTCQTCPIGKYSMTGICRGCEKGTYGTAMGATTMAVCKACPAGYSTFARSSSACQFCPPGTFGLRCTDCLPGTYSSGLGALICDDCEAGTYQTSIGASSILWCVNCESGTYFSGDVTKACEPCPENTISAGGAISSDECWSSDGYYGDAVNGIFQCPVNFYCRRGAKKPAPCPSGHGSSQGSDACKELPQTQPFFEKVFDWIIVACWVIALILGIGFFVKFKGWRLMRTRRDRRADIDFELIV